MNARDRQAARPVRLGREVVGRISQAVRPAGIFEKQSNIIKNISFIVFHLVFFQNVQIFFPKRFFFMMLFLVMNISDDLRKVAFGIRKRTIAYLPLKLAFSKLFFIYPF